MKRILRKQCLCGEQWILRVGVIRYFISYPKVIRTVQAFYKDFFDHWYECEHGFDLERKYETQTEHSR